MRKSCTLRCILALTLLSLVYFEWLIYKVQPLFWKRIHCGDNDTSCTKILFIADPQIQGEHEFSTPLKQIVNWDSDRYLKLTFTEVIKQFQPHVLVFLGDLMDEGSVSTTEEFHDYIKRLNYLFFTDVPVVRVWLPGDNDIGGEHEPIKNDKIRAFENAFSQPSIVMFRNISFYKVHPLMNIYPLLNDKVQDTNYKFVVSHNSVNSKRTFALKVNEVIHPNIYFCAHEHKSKYHKFSKQLSNLGMYPINEGDTLQISTDMDEIYEVFVPTCSYRMGTNSIGYGVAVLGYNSQVQVLNYTVFWSPTRFPHLYLYLMLICVIALYAILRISKHVYKSRFKVALRKLNIA